MAENNTKSNDVAEVPKSSNPIVNYLESPTIRARIASTLRDGEQAFTTSMIAAVNANAALAKCDPKSFIEAAFQAASLNLPIDSNLGFAYLIPYGNRVQFQIGYKGFIQLAQRTGQYKTISAAPIYEGQLVSFDPLHGAQFDFTVQPKAGAKPIGYAAYFQLTNGFEKTMYMTAAEMDAHANKFSQSYRSAKSRSSSLWSTDPVNMGMKTVLKLLISKFGPMSTDLSKPLRRAIDVDQAVIDDDGNLIYMDNPPLEKPDTEMTPEEKADVKSAAADVVNNQTAKTAGQPVEGVIVDEK